MRSQQSFPCWTQSPRSHLAPSPIDRFEFSAGIRGTMDLSERIADWRRGIVAPWLMSWGRYLVLPTGEGIVCSPTELLSTGGLDKAVAVECSGAAARL
jgi:hypothetical protein